MLHAVVYALIALHRADGGQVFINPAQITSLRIVEGARSAYINGRCVVGLTDRKFVAVVESCVEVRRLLEQLGP